MSLPPWNEVGVLPVGVHLTTLEGVRERFVDDAPNREDRELLFDVLDVYLRVVRTLVGPSSVWIDGGLQ